ncbi:hypothetical protein TNCV_3972621 [Trichonephila clavipes]|nr:hypothetical protein TNCV_3972621 [Trichonephila clavipes]
MSSVSSLPPTHLGARERVQSHWDLEAWKTKTETGRLSGIGLGDYKQENLENKSKQDVIMEESSKEGTGPRGAVSPDIMMMMVAERRKDGWNFGMVESLALALWLVAGKVNRDSYWLP